MAGGAGGVAYYVPGPDRSGDPDYGRAQVPGPRSGFEAGSHRLPAQQEHHPEDGVGANPLSNHPDLRSGGRRRQNDHDRRRGTGRPVQARRGRGEEAVRESNSGGFGEAQESDGGLGTIEADGTRGKKRPNVPTPAWTLFLRSRRPRTSRSSRARRAPVSAEGVHQSGCTSPDWEASWCVRPRRRSDGSSLGARVVRSLRGVPAKASAPEGARGVEALADPWGSFPCL